MKLFGKALSYILIISLITLGVSYYKKSIPPEVEDIHPDLYNQPKQTVTNKKEFSFEYEGETYLIFPQFDYELWGLVASHNNINAFYNIYYDEGSVDIKDVCVLYGDTLKNQDFRKIKVKNESWICYYRMPGDIKFNQKEISNNHLLSDKEYIREVIREIRPWDQIYLKGMLVNYCPKSNPDWLRRTSTTRDDTGKRACEVMFVDEARIIKRANHLWYDLFGISKYAVIVALIIKPITFVVSSIKGRKSYYG